MHCSCKPASTPSCQNVRLVRSVFDTEWTALDAYAAVGRAAESCSSPPSMTIHLAASTGAHETHRSGLCTQTSLHSPPKTPAAWIIGTEARCGAGLERRCSVNASIASLRLPRRCALASAQVQAWQQTAKTSSGVRYERYRTACKLACRHKMRAPLLARDRRRLLMHKKRTGPHTMAWSVQHSSVCSCTCANRRSKRVTMPAVVRRDCTRSRSSGACPRHAAMGSARCAYGAHDLTRSLSVPVTGQRMHKPCSQRTGYQRAWGLCHRPAHLGLIVLGKTE